MKDRNFGDHLVAAVEGFGGGFALMRAVRVANEIVDWELLFANQFVRSRWLEQLPAAGGYASEFENGFDVGALGSLQRVALDAGETREAAFLVDAPTGPEWRRVVSVPVDVDIVASLTYDISDLVDLQARVAALSEHALDIVAITDASANIQWVSSAAQRVLGHDPAALVGRPAADLMYGDDVDATLARFSAVVTDPDASGTPIEVRIVDAAGHPRWFECVGVNQLDNPLIAGLVVSLHDIHERKQSEAALRLSEARNRSIVETAGDGIITLDDNGAILTFNQAAERMFGSRASDIIGRTYPDLIPPPAADHLRGQIVGGGLRNGPTEVLGLRNDGTEFPIQVSLSSTSVDGSTIYTAIVRDITRQRQIEDQLEHMALHDDLTGLPNRRAVLERLRAIVARPAAVAGHVVGVLYLDLDDFKLVNDSLGQEVGDRLLVSVADRISGALEPGDALGRPGGDEFIVLCDLRRNLDSFRRVATNITDVLRAPFTVGRHEVFVTASIGIAASRGDETTVELLRNADTAMHRAKQRGRGQVEIFDQGMRIELAARK
jgi:diguanylate cyclase (GGDEF)-like protein/PAS domain S-box-containing protein